MRFVPTDFAPGSKGFILGLKSALQELSGAKLR